MCWLYLLDTNWSPGIQEPELRNCLIRLVWGNVCLVLSWFLVDVEDHNLLLEVPSLKHSQGLYKKVGWATGTKLVSSIPPLSLLQFFPWMWTITCFWSCCLLKQQTVNQKNYPSVIHLELSQWNFQSSKFVNILCELRIICTVSILWLDCQVLYIIDTKVSW